jgi:hypothetical protein
MNRSEKNETDNMLDFNYRDKCLLRSPSTKYQKPCQDRFVNACHNDNNYTYDSRPGLNVPDFKRSIQIRLQDDPEISPQEINELRRCDLNQLCKDKHLDKTAPPPSIPLPPTPYIKTKPPKISDTLPETPNRQHSPDISDLKLPITFRCHNINRQGLTKLIQKYTKRPSA